MPDCEPNLFQLGEPPEDQSIPPEHAKHIRRQPGTPGITCPYCGYDDDDDEFLFRDDIKAAQQYIEWAAMQDVGEHFDNLAKDFNRSMKRAGGGLFELSMKVQRPRKSRPFAWREDLLRDIRCNICGCSYGVYAIGLYCPDCGVPNLKTHFQREAELIVLQIALAQEMSSQGKQELAYRLMGNAHEDVLTAFEAYQKVVYRHLVRLRTPDRIDELLTKRTIGNRFQNIARARGLWNNLSLDPFSLLSEDELTILALNVEKRHVAGHNLSLADQAYLDAAKAEEHEQLGRTVPLLGDDISRFIELCRQVISQLNSELEYNINIEHEETK
ncbi:MAG: hypothetical protein V3V99_11130 [candidate division Zixibacteria bacterium]